MGDHDRLQHILYVVRGRTADDDRPVGVGCGTGRFDLLPVLFSQHEKVLFLYEGKQAREEWKRKQEEDGTPHI